MSEQPVRIRRRTVLASLFSVAAGVSMYGCLGPAYDLADDAMERTLTHDGRTRRYRLVTPSAEGPHPTVVFLHGGGGNPERVARHTGFDKAGPEAGVAVAYPAGVGGWNDGRDGVTRAHRENVDDVGFLRELVRTLVEDGVADPAAVAFAGISNGAFMTHRFVIESSVGLTAAATVAGSIAPAIEEEPDEPVPIVLVHGTDDPLVPYDGGAVGFGGGGGGGRGSAVPAEEAVERFVEANGCDTTPEVSVSNDRRDGTRLETRRYEGPAPVVHHVVHGGGHLWPGSRDGPIDLFTGARSRELDATEEVLDFLDAESS